MCAKNIAKPKYEIVGDLERYNEADNAQARGALIPDSDLWKDYYKKHPDLEDLGRSFDKLPPMGSVGPIQDQLMVASIFETISLLSKDEYVDGTPSPEKFKISPERATEKLKGFTRHLGADLVNIGPLNPAWIYSHVGRANYPGKEIGPEINLPHNSAIVAAIHLDLKLLHSAPGIGSNIEIIKTYLRLASIVVTLARYIRFLGYSARAHDVMNYQVIIPPIAIDAGLGELGRNGVLINEKYGNALKMAVVTTDLPLIYDKPVDIGVEEYCRGCNICGKYCPVGAIPLTQEKKVVRGVRKWKINDNACYRYWRTVGTDCGICMSVCPWSRPRHFPHNAVLKAVENSSIARKAAIQAEKLVRREVVKPPHWLEEPTDEWKENIRKGHPYKK
jgi:ferredoxin